MNAPKVRLGDLGRMIRGSGIRRNETVPEGLPCIRYGEIYTSYNVVLDRPRSFVPPSLYEKCPHIKKGDLVLALTGENKEEIAKSLAYFGEEEVAAGGDTAVWTGHGCDPLYLAYMMYSPRMIKAKADASNGHIVVHASVKKLQQIEVSLPPLSEQRKIGAFVDKAIKRVDAIERQFEKLRRKADEYLLSAMSGAFTSSTGKKALADVCKSMSVGIVVRPTRYYVKDGLRAFRNTNIRPNAVRDADWICVDRRAIFENPRSEVKSGDVVVARSGLPGVAAVIEARHDGYAAIDVLILKPDPDSVDSHYLAYYINTPHSQALIKRMNNGVAQSHVGLTNIAKLPVAVPELREQRRIVAALDAARRRAGEFDALAARGLANCARMRKAILAEAFAV